MTKMLLMKIYSVFLVNFFHSFNTLFCPVSFSPFDFQSKQQQTTMCVTFLEVKQFFHSIKKKLKNQKKRKEKIFK